MKYPLSQIYDGNNATVGHLFQAGATKSLCGRNLQDMSAPVLEKEFSEEQIKEMSWVHFSLNKTCKRCRTVAMLAAKTTDHASSF